MACTAPVYLHIFNRHDHTKRVLNAIRAVKPRKLYVVGDGPRSWVPTDTAECLSTRKLIEQIDWQCDVSTMYFDENLGSYKAYVSGVSWLFSKEESAILLEDDDLPHVEFFAFCSHFLKVFENDLRVFSITGNNFDKKNEREASFFSKFPSAWGWATWASRWNGLNFEFDKAMILNEKKYRKMIYSNFYEADFYNQYFLSRMAKQYPPNWDFVLIYNSLINGQLNLVPPTNLVKNIGFANSGATHTNFSDPFSMVLPKSNYVVAKDEPYTFLPDHAYDEFVNSKVGPRGLRGFISRKIRGFNI